MSAKTKRLRQTLLHYGVYQQRAHQTEFLSRTKWPLYWLEAVSYSKEKSKSLYLLFFWKTGYRQAISPCLPPCLPSVALSPCSVLRSTGELYLICDRIILLFSLHLVHAGDIALEWENHWLVVGYVCVCLCMVCMCEVRRHYMKMHRMHDVKQFAEN